MYLCVDDLSRSLDHLLFLAAGWRGHRRGAGGRTQTEEPGIVVVGD